MSPEKWGIAWWCWKTFHTTQHKETGKPRGQRESCHCSEAAKVHLSLWALAWCHVCNSGHFLSRDHAHLLRSLRSLQNARSCSGRRNSQTPGAHYHYLCFYLTKDSQGRQAWHHQRDLSLAAHSPRGGFSFQLLSSPKYYLRHRGLSCHFLFQIQCLWYH